MRAVFVSILAAYLTFLGTAGRAAESLEARLTRVAEAHGVSDRTPGFAVLVREKDKAVFQRGYGAANVAGNRLIDHSTTFELASLSKPFTSIAVCLLHDRGKLSFDDDVRKHVPELPERTGEPPIRLADLLQHTSGLPDYLGLDAPEPARGAYVTNDDYVRLIKAKPQTMTPRFKPGERYEYSNTNFMLLAVVVERVAGVPYARFMDEEVFRPLGMTHTWVNDRADAPPDDVARRAIHAVGYETRKGGWKATWGAPPVGRDAVLTVGDGGVWSSLEDLARFDDAVRGRKLLKPATWERALTPSRTRDGKTNGYGFGWMLWLGDDGHDGNRVTAFGHNGSWGGFKTAYRRDVERDRAFVVLSNREDFEMGEGWLTASDLLDEHGTR